MPILRFDQPEHKPSEELEASWDFFKGGLNLFLQEKELGRDELAEADNIMLVGQGVPTVRWGQLNYFLGGEGGCCRGLSGFYTSAGTNELLAVTDWGYLTKKNGASYTMISGASWASGYDAWLAQLDNKMYIVNVQRELARYEGTTLTGFATIAVPSGVAATQCSGVSGANAYSYLVSAISWVGETLAASAALATQCPQDLSDGAVKVTWTPVSAASGIIKGGNIYGRSAGDESFLWSVDAASTTFIDDGTATPYLFTYPPTTDTTGGVNAKYMIRFQDRLIYGGIVNDPSKVVISGRVPNQEKLDLSYGGNYIRIEPDSGDDVTGLAIFEDKIIVFKENSIWQISLGTQKIGNYYVTIPSLKLITASHGCIAPKSIQAVENDTFFMGRNGIYALGYEPNIMGVVRTNEISLKIRPYFDGLTTD